MPATDPIRVYAEDGECRIDYGSGYHQTRSEAVETATQAASSEGRELEIEAEAESVEPRPQRR